MSKFGKYAILVPVTHYLEKQPEWYWKIKPTDTRGEMEVARLLSTERVRIDADGMRSKLYVTTLEVAIKEIACTFGGTNIPDANLPDDATIEQVEELLRQTPRDLILELWEAVGDACPGWGPREKRVKSLTPETLDAEAKNE